MKTIYKKILPFILSAEIIILSFCSCSISVYAADFIPHDIIEAVEYGIEHNDWDPFYNFFYSSWDGLAYLYCQMGALVTKDFQAWVNNNNALESLANIVPARKEDNNIVFTKEFMAQLKALLDEYAKTEQTKEENGGFYLIPTTKFDEVPVNNFYNSQQYRTFRNIVIEKGVLPVQIQYRYMLHFVDPFSDPDHPIALIGTLSSLNAYINDPEETVSCSFYCFNDWKYESQPILIFPSMNEIYTSCSDAFQSNTSTTTGYTVTSYINTKEIEREKYIIYSTTGERVRVFASEYAAQNYSVGNRKIYFSENYYNYVPEDLTVSIDDLQKSVDDLQKVIDELLKQINDNSSEKEIEELLRLILEELRKNPGGGGGSGGGDVTVSVDLKETNSWLSKIYNRLGDILSKMSESAGQSMDTVVESIENLKEMLEKYMKNITSDLGDIKDQLEDMTEEEFADKSDSFLDSSMESFSEIGELAKTKFPLSIPYDLYNLLKAISPSPPEASTANLLPAEQTAKTYSSPAVYQSNGKIISVTDGAENSGETVQLSSTGAPVFHLPIVVESVGWDYAITVDMSRFQTVANLSRTFFTLIFILGLINLTIKIAGLWGDLID